MNNEPNHNSEINDDAFDREAAEGFGLLGSEREIAALKAETDKAFAEQFKQQQIKAKAPWLWMAAAFVIVGLGLTLFSVLSPDRKMDVAQVPNTTVLQNPVPSDASVPAETGASDKIELKNLQTTTLSKENASENSTKKEEQASNKEFKAQEKAALTEPEQAAAEGIVIAQSGAAASAPPIVYGSSSANNNAVYTPSATPVELKLAEDEALVVRKEETAKSKKMPEAKALSSKPTAPAAAIADNDFAGVIILAPGLKKLKTDAKELLKNFQLPKEITIDLFLDANGRVLSAAITSKAAITESEKLAAQLQLQKLSNASVIPAPGSKIPCRYSFELKR